VAKSLSVVMAAIELVSQEGAGSNDSDNNGPGHHPSVSLVNLVNLVSKVKLSTRFPPPPVFLMRIPLTRIPLTRIPLMSIPCQRMHKIQNIRHYKNNVILIKMNSHINT
jgi:hypothetical protein